MLYPHLSRYFLFACFLLLSLNACQTSPTESNDSSKLHHIVLVWFNDNISETEQKIIRKKSDELRNIAGILSLEWGTAIPSERAIVDDSFDLGIVMTFRDQASMQAYLDHPQHKAFIKQYIKGKTKKLLVYDF